MRVAAAGFAAGASLLLLAACGDAGGAAANLLGGEYGGTNASGQQVVIDVESDHVVVNGVIATYDDPSTNAGFTVSLNHEMDDFNCVAADDLHTISCHVHRVDAKTVQVPCQNLSASPGTSASASPAVTNPAGGPAMCTVPLAADETVSLLRICTSAPCNR